MYLILEFDSFSGQREGKAWEGWFYIFVIQLLCDELELQKAVGGK